MRAEHLVEIIDLGGSLDAKRPILLADDVVLGFIEIVFILDLADDLLQHVLDRHQTRHATVLVDDDGDMVAIGAKFLQ